MSLNEIFGSALSGLGAAQAGLRTVSNNIANVGTPGYARQKLSVTTAVSGGKVNGVTVGETSRVADRFLETTVYKRAGDVGQADVTSSYLDRLQALLGAPGADSGLPAQLDEIRSSAIAMTADPSSAQAVAGFTNNVQDAIGSMQQLSSDVSALRGDVESAVGQSVDRINALLVRVHGLNDEVARLEGLGRSTAGPADQRNSALEELGGLMKVSVRDQPDGRVTVETASGLQLLDRRLRQLSYPSAGGGIAQPDYQGIEIRFAEANGQIGPATGDKIDSASVGGRLGGLLDLRDRSLPAFAEKMGVLFGGLAETVNAVSNAGTTVPAPAELTGNTTSLIGGDRLGFTGAATFAVTSANGTLVAKARVDFDALGAGATIDDAVAAINAGLGGAGQASFVDGKLTIRASGTGNGISISQDPNSPSARGGVGFSQYFGLNDLVRSETSTLTPSGFVAADPTGFGTGETTELVLRDSTGRAVTRFTLTAASGDTFGDVVNRLNQSPLGGFGSFALDTKGRLQFEPSPGVPGATLSIPSDSTSRYGSGRPFSAIMGLTGAESGLSSAGVRRDILGDASKLPLARLQEGVAVGGKALGAADNRGAAALVDALAGQVDLGKNGKSTLDRFSSLLMGEAGTQASRAAESLADASARQSDAVNRRDSYSGVNIDEELANMVVLQNSYSASARIITTATQMYDTLIAMMG
ncbi:FlgK family flagellar hook-associated protein [Sphingomonas aerophila]|uniref:Flagellar hook-associated protein 1 n=1 Tax=Sphingomonas aerophila TaxID=1344948 RepID=A0A7W9BAN4_9SPHN|nr:flagellar hook-associated protein 1 FlgK [Sphingomonas aerophila]